MGLNNGGLRAGGLRNLSEINILPDNPVDSFEDYQPSGSASLSDRYSGDLGDFSIESSSPIQGSQSLRMDPTSDGQAMMSFSGDGLANYPEQGLEFACHVQPSGARPHTLFGTSDPSDVSTHYAIEVSSSSSNFRLFKRVSGSFTNLDETNPSLSDGTTYDVGIEWATDGSIVCTLYDLDGQLERDGSITSVSVTDTDISEPAAGFGNAGQVEAIWDNYRVVREL